MTKPGLILLFVLLSGFRLVPYNETDTMIMHAADGQLPLLVSRIKPGEEQLYGFTESDDLDDCTPGKPYRILTLSSDFYTGDFDENKDYIVMKNEWRVPVKLNGQSRNLLTLSGNSGNYVVSAMGDTLLAQELQQKSVGIDSSDAFYILKASRIHADFFVYETNNSFGEAQFIPLPSAVAAIPALSNNIKKAYTLTEVEQMIKQTLEGGPTDKQPSAAKPSVSDSNESKKKTKAK